jgi:hypothetical protein
MRWFSDFCGAVWYRLSGLSGFAEKRRRQKAEDAVWELIYTEVINALANGVDVEDIWVPMLDAPVEWNVGEQVWTVKSSYDLKVGKLVELVSGRGGAVERCRISHKIAELDGVSGESLYALSYKNVVQEASGGDVSD